MVIIDSLNGYMQAMPDVKFLNIQLHELLTFLSHRGIVTILTVAQQGILGANMTTPIDLTYLADTVVLLRFFEQDGEIKKAISILKKRIGFHEATIRQIATDRKGIQVGEVLRQFQGVLTGTPTFQGNVGTMIEKR
jgi:circadian clock protein KaiC